MRFIYGFAGALLALGFVLYPVLAVSYSSGAPASANGSPASLASGGIGDCTACHFTYELNEGTGSVTIDAPATFMPGETVAITVTVDNTTPPVTTPKQGFEVSVEDGEAAHIGQLVIVDAANTRFASDEENYVTHTSAGNAQTTWTVNWTAPADPPETVTIYAAGNAANGNFSPTDDYVYTTSVTMQRATVSNEEPGAPLVARLDAVYPNPFVGAATVDYTLDRAQVVTVTLLDGLGRAVRVLHDGPQQSGSHTLRIDAGDLPGGVYFVEVRTPEALTMRPVTLAR